MNTCTKFFKVSKAKKIINLISLAILFGVAFFSCGIFQPEEEKTLPVVETLRADSVSTKSAIVYGMLTDEGNSEISELGFCLSTSTNLPVITDHKEIAEGDENNFSAVLTLDPGKTYNVRAYAINQAGVSYGKEIVVKTLGGGPEISQLKMDTITESSFELSFELNANYLETRVWLEYGQTKDYGEKIEIKDLFVEKEIIKIKVPNLKYCTVYHYQIKSFNLLGSLDIKDSLETTGPTLTDIDGNLYRSVRIGKQIWLTENFKAVHYNDDTPIPHFPKDEDWLKAAEDKVGAYCYYNNDPELGKVYGALYNWYVASSPKIAPEGWHVATEREWRDLSIQTAILHLKEKGYEHWKYSDKVASATNETGFTALPGGSRGISNKTFLLNFADLGIDAIWWNPAEYEYKETAAKIIYIEYDKAHFKFEYVLSKLSGCSIRLIKDQK